ncbi:hypothetical protein F5X68DRAFT_254049 [Plectosphaerella plurivora]|uniref:NAD-dependent epimerase/dehydratase domain-containing protein n=1 Tax=Plectosphaerella plurivora TaxID=936078 RepID=A0A9P8VDQ2_9PEZI|nr:hypothetical protein F5X68DRAFT_254049 [Plectosphaerella plurivora]
MSQNILITGAGGYIGGSILADFLKSDTAPIINACVIAAVRSAQQADKIAKLGVKVVPLDMKDEKSVEETIIGNEIDVVLHTASSHEPNIASHLIAALGRRCQLSGRLVSFIHTSGTTAFAPEAGWPAEQVKDTDNVYDIEKRISAHHPIRLTDVGVIDEGEAHGVNTYIVVVPSVYGKGSGEGKKLSIAFPIFIRASIRDRVVRRFDQDGTPFVSHISDLVSFYRLLTENILNGTALRSGKDGYYFPMAHKTSNWAVMNAFARRLHAAGLVEEAEPGTWTSDEAAAEALGIPVQIVRVMGTHSTHLTPMKPHELGWKPKWNEELLLSDSCIDQEIQNVLEEDGA